MNEKIESLTRAIDRAKNLFDKELRARTTCKIYDFLPIISHNKIFEWSDKPLIELFQKQFIIQAALIELQEDYRVLCCPDEHVTIDPEDKKMLILSPVNVALVDHESFADEHAPGQALEEAAASVVLEHYRDYERFFSVSEETVSQLLESFWVKFNAFEEKDLAFVTLGLASDSEWEHVNETYRAKASQHHPDRGGDHDEFIKIRQAYEILKTHFGK